MIKMNENQYRDLVDEQRIGFNNYFRKKRDMENNISERSWQKFWARYYGIEKQLQMISRMAPFDHALSLDLGCGTGEYSCLLYSFNSNTNIIAIDISQEAIKRAYSKLIGTGNAKFVNGDI